MRMSQNKQEDLTKQLSLTQILSPPYLENPYPLYDQLRLEPVYWDAPLNGWVLTRYKDVLWGLRDPRLSARRSFLEFTAGSAETRARLSPFAHDLTARVLGQHLLWLDKPEHLRLRHVLHKAFAPQTLAALQPMLQQRIDRFFDGVETQEAVDVINEFAYPLLATLIVSLLGLPPESIQQLITWDKHAGILFDAGMATPEQFEQAWRNTTSCIQWLQQLITEQRAYPPNTLIQQLLDARQRGDICSEEELLAYCYLLMIAGFGTTVNTFGLGLLALLQFPAQLEAWRQDPSLTPSAIEELFRYSSTVQTTSRLVLQDLEIGNKTIRAGQRLILCLGAANRDPAQFPNPSQLHLRNAPNPHLTFAPGIHHCLGVPLARFQLSIMFAALFRRFPAFRLATPALSYHPSLTFRALESLSILFR